MHCVANDNAIEIVARENRILLLSTGEILDIAGEACMKRWDLGSRSAGAGNEYQIQKKFKNHNQEYQTLSKGREKLMSE